MRRQELFYSSGRRSTLTIINSTLVGNTAVGGPGDYGVPPGDGLGGAIFADGSRVRVINSTIVHNTTGVSNCPYYCAPPGHRMGGGIYISGTLNLANSVVAANVGDASPDLTPSATPTWWAETPSSVPWQTTAARRRRCYRRRAAWSWAPATRRSARRTRSTGWISAGWPARPRPATSAPSILVRACSNWG